MKQIRIAAVFLGMLLAVGVSLGVVQFRTNAESNPQAFQKNTSIAAETLINSVGQKTISLNEQLRLDKISEDTRVYEEASELVSQVQDKTVSQKIIVYEDNRKNKYEFSQETGFISYSSYEYANNLSPDSSEAASNNPALRPNEINIEKVQAVLEDTIPLSVLIPDFEKYKVKSTDSAYGLSVTLEKEISPELQDQIFIDFSSNGSVEHIGTYQTNLTQITDAQKAEFEQKFQDYLKKLQGEYERYTISSITYKKTGNQILANYSVIFYTATDAEDMKLGDLVTFVIDTE